MTTRRPIEPHQLGRVLDESWSDELANGILSNVTERW
jgi:hypothetical protein